MLLHRQVLSNQKLTSQSKILRYQAQTRCLDTRHIKWAIILPPRTDGKLWVGTVTWTSSKPVELVVLHGYTNVTADSAHGVPLIAKPPTGAVAITLIGPSQFMPSSDPVPSGTAPFAGSAVAFHTLSGAKFTVTYTVDATANTPTKTK